MSENLIKGGVFPTPIGRIKAWDVNINFINEFQLELEHVPVLVGDAVPQIQLVDQKLKLNGEFLKPEIEVGIPAENFYVLYRAADGMKTIRPGEKYVTGLKIHYGAREVSEDIYEFQAVYQPVIMHQKNVVIPNDFEITKVGKYYYYDGNAFEVFVDQNDAQILKQTYKDKIEILHYGQATPSPHDSAKNDVEATVFPFQTIYTLVVDNLHPPTRTCIYLFNSIREDVPPLANEFRHCVLMSTMKEDHGITDFINKYANRSHLCPPCTIKYELA